MICDKCKTEISNTSKFCPKCGNKVESEKHQENKIIKCPQCGAENSVNAKFCRVDGYKLQQSKTEATEKSVTSPNMVICPVCGTQNSSLAKFCIKDGIPLVKKDSTTEKAEIVQKRKITQSKPDVIYEKIFPIKKCT